LLSFKQWWKHSHGFSLGCRPGRIEQLRAMNAAPAPMPTFFGMRLRSVATQLGRQIAPAAQPC